MENQSLIQQTPLPQQPARSYLQTRLYNKKGIYKIVNKENGKFYVGSSIKIAKRWWSHKKALRLGIHHNLHLQRAWNKNGKDSFDFVVERIIPDNSSEEELLKIEQEYLDKSVGQEDCYNIAKVADKPDTSLNQIPVKQINISDDSVIREWKSIVSAASGLGLNSESCIANCCKGRLITYGGYRWEFAEPERAAFFTRKQGQHGGHGRRVIYKLDPKTNQVIEEYESLTEAAEKNSIKSYLQVLAVCKGKRSTAGGGLVFCYKENIGNKQEAKEESLFNCRVCGIGNIKNLRSLASHLQIVHKLKSEDYTIKHLCLEGKRPICQKEGCNKETRYSSFSFIKTCKEHSKEAMSLGGQIGGRVKETWNKGKTKETDMRLYQQSLLVSGNAKIYSSGKEEIADYLRTGLGIQQIDLNRRDIIPPLELDILIPEANIAIEYNGLYWHARENDDDNNNNRRLLHSTKTKRCLEQEKQISLIHIFSDEWANKKDLIKSMICSRLGKSPNKVFARKCEILRELSPKEAKDFFEESHISGHVRSNLCYGLIYEDKIVAAMSLRKPFHKEKYEKEFVLEIARFACKPFYTVPGGFSRLLKVAEDRAREEGFKSLLSYCDRRFGEGKVYLNNGFDLVGETPSPGFWWTNGRERFNRFKFKADKSNNKTEKEVAKENGVYRVYGCGHNIYMKK
jgi:hypothetical protein